MKVEAKTKEEIFKLIKPHTEIVVLVPWNNEPIPVTIRMLDSVTLTACGEFNTVSANIDLSSKDSEADKDSLENIVTAKNIHENILKQALVHPTFDEFNDFLIGLDFYTQKKKELDELQVNVKKIESVEQRNRLQNEIDLLELSMAFLFPEDFTATIVSIILQKEVTDLHKLTKESLLKAGFLGEKYNTRPSTYFQGIFTEKNKEDIDAASLILVGEYRKSKEIEKGSKTKWIRGNNKG